MTKNIIAFQKGFIVTPNQGIDNRSMAMNVQAELMRLGFMLDQDALEQLGYSDAADIIDFNNEVIDYLLTMMGGKRDYQPFYPGFPQQVMEMSEYECWVNQLRYYYSGCKFEPSPWTETKKVAFEHVKYKMISSGTEEQFEGIFKLLCSSGQSLTPNDLKVIIWFVKNYKVLQFPERIPFKENLSVLLGTLIEEKRDLSNVVFPKLTTTDILRVVVHLSGGDASLPAVPKKHTIERVLSGRRWSAKKVDNPERDKFKFKKFKRAERKIILAMLEASNLDIRDMKLKSQRWIRLGEILHPGEFASLFPRAFNAFQMIRNEKVKSWYGQVDLAFSRSYTEGLEKLSERPGEFVRKLDYLVRKAKGDKMLQLILDQFTKVGEKVSNKVLFEVMDHFENRKVANSNRSIFIKGARKRTPLPTLPALSPKIISLIQDTAFESIKAKFALLEPLGDCWVDEELKKIPLPTNMRSMSDSLVPVVRGQRTPIGGTKNILRPFIHWYDSDGTMDIDLHGFLLKSDGTSPLSFGYNGEHSNIYGCYSGDVRNRRGACAEYVDININTTVRDGYQYFAMIAHNFQNYSFNKIKDCVVGTMELDQAISNKNWKPDTISNCVIPQSTSSYCLIGVYDLKTREYIHLDMDWGVINQYITGRNSRSIFDAIAPYTELPKTSIYDLVMWHVNARGRIVDKASATTHFMFEDFSSNYTKAIELLGV